MCSLEKFNSVGSWLKAEGAYNVWSFTMLYVVKSFSFSKLRMQLRAVGQYRGLEEYIQKEWRS